MIHRRDGEDAVMMGDDYYNSLQEALYLLGYPAKAEALFKAIAQDKADLAWRKSVNYSAPKNEPARRRS